MDRLSGRVGFRTWAWGADGRFRIYLHVRGHANILQGLIAVQNAVQPSQVPIGVAILIFFQNFGTSVAIVISNTIFAQTLTKTIPRYAPSVAPQAALNAGSGAGAVRSLVLSGREDELQGVLRAYSESLRNVFYLLVGMAGLAAFLSLGMGWKDVSKKKKGAVNDTENGGTEERSKEERSKEERSPNVA
jgi:hypothetical protein